LNKSESKYFNTAIKFNKALLFLLEKKSFEYITISEICETAGVNRSTFYLHYENTCDLLQETTRYVLDNFMSYFSVDIKTIPSKFENCNLKELNFITEEYLHPYFSYIKENKSIFSAVLSQPIAFDFNSIFQRLFTNIFNPILDRFNYPDDERRYVMMFYLNGLTALVKEWLKDDCKKSIEEMSEIIQHCILGKPPYSILPQK
jgi:AcrR family transcriptional regulator